MTSHRVKRRRIVLRWLPTVLVLLAVIAAGIVLSRFHGPRPPLAAPPTTVSPAAQFNRPAPAPAPASSTPRRPATSAPPAAPLAAPAPRPCHGNADAQRVIVSVAQQPPGSARVPAGQGPPP